MWNDFTDFEIAELAFKYNLDSTVKFDLSKDYFKLANRGEVECLIEEAEYHLAFDKESV
jgi:hypothetical protein